MKATNNLTRKLLSFALAFVLVLGAVIVLIVIVGALLFALMQTGGGKAMGSKLKRNVSEMTGGLIGKKKDENT